jgi:hypothetical protein
MRFIFQSSEIYLEFFAVFQNFKMSGYFTVPRGILNDVSQNHRIPRMSCWEELSQPVTLGIIVEGTESNNTYSSESICPCCIL